jgi:hypothetical protein
MTNAEIKKHLRDVGCPYGAEDFRAKLWLDGYKAGFVASHKNAIASLNSLIGKAA